MSDCLVIGGGVIGMMSARALVISGASVTLLDKSECGGESSWAGGGIISPLYPWHYDDLTNELSFASQVVYEELCDELYESSGINPQYIKSGLLMLDEYDSETAVNWMDRFNVSYKKQGNGALFTNIAQVRNPRLLQALKVDIVRKGVKVVENTQVQSISLSGDRAMGVKTNKGEFIANNTLSCSGAWSGDYLDLEDEVFPMKGQMIVLKSEAESIKNIILDQGRYIIPRADGRVLVGSTMEDVGFDRSTDEDTKNALRRFAVDRFPILNNAKIERHWSGFRPASRSGKVTLGRHSRYENLFVNTGHFRNGLNMAPESARRIKKLINNE